MVHRAPSSSSISYKWTYDVFLSFHGEDTRLGFASHLHQSLLQRGIRVFLDDYCIRSGENITPSLFSAIEESRIAIIVFSENYASSTFCLRELEKIMECFKGESRLIYPVFYHVEPSELRKPSGTYAKALARLDQRFEDDRQKVEKWRQALSQAADLKGVHLKHKITNEQEFITRITNEVDIRIKQELLDVTNYPVGLVSRAKEVISLLDLWSTKETKMIGIWGPGGIGKSTIARAVYNSIAHNFEALCFLSNVRKQSKEPNGLSRLQETLLGKLVMSKDLCFSDYHEGIPLIKHRLGQKKILLILDDVDESNQLKALAGSCNWFGSGSRIVITSREKQLLRSHGIESIHHVKELNGEESLKLLSWYAFKTENMDSKYVEVCNRAVDYLCGYPLALEVIGSNLFGKGVNHWNKALNQFKSRPRRRVLDVLKLSFDTLEEEEKQIFLDLACFFNGEKLTYIIDILQCVRAIEPECAIDTLIDKSLIKIERGCVTMHDLIEDVGKEIVRQESPNEPGRRSRLWLYEDILQVLQLDMGTETVEAITLDLPQGIQVQWGGEEFMKMKNLKMLLIRKACFSECPKYLPNSLRWLEWKGYPFKFLPYQKFPYLGHLDLRNCKFLYQIPDLSGASNLTELWLDNCTNLTEIHNSVGCLNKLRKWSAMRCNNLKILPSSLSLTSLKHLNLFGCSSLQRFPEISVMMEKMQTLDLDKTSITELPSSICNLIGLEILNMDECHHLKQLPGNIYTLPNLWCLTANLCEGMSHFNKMSEGGDEESFDSSAMSLKMTHLYFKNCNLSDDSLAFCLSHFTNMIHLDLSSNNFTILPECIKENHNLKYLLLDNCNQLQHIGGMPPNLEKFSAICCTSLTKLSKRKVLKQAFNFPPGKRNFIFPGKEFPERLHYCSWGSFLPFWVRNVFPTTSLWILVKDDQDYLNNCKLSVHINGTKLDISSEWLLLLTIKADHIFICDMQSIFQSEKLPLGNKWNQVKVSIESKKQEMKGEKGIYFGLHVHDLQSNLENIQFVDPRRSVEHKLLQKIQELDGEELEEDMNLDSFTTKSAESIESLLHYQDQPQDREELEDDKHQDVVKSTESQEIMSYEEREIMHEFQSYQDLEIVRIEGYRGTTFPTWLGSPSYDCLIELHLNNCNNCRRIPALGQLPSLSFLTIERLQSIVAIGYEFLKADDCAASLVPFPSLDALHFGGMFSWEEWHSVDMQAFPKLRSLRIHGCPKLIGNLPRQLLSLECLEIMGCPLLTSSIPKCPKIHELHIFQSQNVVLQELPPSLRRLAISGAQMLEALSETLHIEDLYVWGCSHAVPLPVIHMPPTVEKLTIANSENVKFVLLSESPLHLQRISIYDCKFLTPLFVDVESLGLPTIKELSIERCPDIKEPISPGFLLSSLERLDIRNCDNFLSCHIEWYHFRTITTLCISTQSQTFYCGWLQHLTSLKTLEIRDSPELENIEGGMLAPSLHVLDILDCRLLKERCCNKDEEIWPKISHIPSIFLDGMSLRGLEHILEDQDMNDATIQVQPPSKLRAMIKFFKGCFKIN